jgi:hypothetical protein
MLSPDGRFYWDGVAWWPVSPDGTQYWDGSRLLPVPAGSARYPSDAAAADGGDAGRPRYTAPGGQGEEAAEANAPWHRRRGWMVATSFLLPPLGLYWLWRRRLLPKDETVWITVATPLTWIFLIGVAAGASHVRPTSTADCGQSFFTAGGSVAAGDVGCGGFHLGQTVATQDCLSNTESPAFNVVQDDFTTGQIGPPDIDPAPGANGCEMSAASTPHPTDVRLRTVAQVPSPVVIVSDFTPKEKGRSGVALVWCVDARQNCIGVFVRPKSPESVDFALADGSITLQRGTKDHVAVLNARTSRLILRVADGQIDAWIDGTKLVSASSKNTDGVGHAEFAVASSTTLGPSAVYLRRFDVVRSNSA